MLAEVRTAEGVLIRGVHGPTCDAACELARNLFAPHPEGTTITCGVRQQWMFYVGRWTRTRGKGWVIDRSTLIEASKGWVRIGSFTEGTLSVSADPSQPGGVEIRQADGSAVGFLLGDGKLHREPDRRFPVESERDQVIAWGRENDGGISAWTLAAAMCPGARDYLDGRLGPWRWDGPYDGADVGRCVRLLDRFPHWRTRMAEVAAFCPRGWAPLIDRWPEIEAAFREDEIRPPDPGRKYPPSRSYWLVSVLRSGSDPYEHLRPHPFAGQGVTP